MDPTKASKRDERRDRVLTLKQIQSELSNLNKDLEDKAGDRGAFLKACQNALLTLRCADRKLRDLLKCPYWTPNDMESCYGCNLKLQEKFQEREDAAIKLKNLRDEWYAQQKHLRKFSTKLKEVEERQKMQSVRCTRHGLVFSRMLWKLSGLPFMIEYITANCERDLKGVMLLMENCIYGFMKSFGTEVSDLKCEEYQYVLALCGILTNISSVPDGRHYLMTVPICHDVFDAIIKYIPQISTSELQILKWLMLVSIYNITSNPLGLKYAMSHKGLTEILNTCLETYNKTQIIDLTIHIIKRLVEEIHGPKHLRHIFMNYPIERIVEIGKTQEVPGASEPAGFIVMNIGKAFEKYGELAQLDVPAHRSFEKFPTFPCNPCPSKSSILTDPEVKKIRPRSKATKPTKKTATSIKVKPKPRHRDATTSPAKVSTACGTCNVTVSSKTSAIRDFSGVDTNSPCISTTSLPSCLKTLMGTQIKSAAPTEVDFNQAKAEIAAAKKPIQEEKSAVETLYALPDQSKFSSLSEDIKEFLESCGPGEAPCRSKTRPLNEPSKEPTGKKSTPLLATTKETSKTTRTKSDKELPWTNLPTSKSDKSLRKILTEISSKTYQVPSDNPSEKKYRVVKKFNVPKEENPSKSNVKASSQPDDNNNAYDSESPHSQYVLQEYFSQEEPCRNDPTWKSELPTVPCEAASKLIMTLLSKLDLDKYLQQTLSKKGIPFKDPSKKPLSLTPLERESDRKSLNKSIEEASKAILEILSKLDLDRYFSPSYSGTGIPWKDKDDDALMIYPSRPLTEKDMEEMKRLVRACSSRNATADVSRSSQCSNKRVSFPNSSM